MRQQAEGGIVGNIDFAGIVAKAQDSPGTAAYVENPLYQNKIYVIFHRSSGTFQVFGNNEALGTLYATSAERVLAETVRIYDERLTD